MKIVIIEDEPLVAISLAKLVSSLEPGATIIGPLRSVADSKRWFSENPQPDLVLADIQLSDGISLDIFSGTFPGCPIIFTTAYNEFAIRAFKLNSIDYLLKPVERSDLQSAFQKFRLLQSKFTNETYLRHLMEVFSHFSQNKQYKQRFAVHAGQSVTLIPNAEVVCFLKEELIYLVSQEGKKYITDYRSLDEIEELVDPGTYFRANRQRLVHLPFIDSYRTDDTGKLQLRFKNIKPDDTIISKDKAAEFRKWFEK